MLPSFFNFSRYETNRTPGQSFLWWTLGAYISVDLTHAFTRIGLDALTVARPTTDLLAFSGATADRLSFSGPTTDLLAFSGPQADTFRRAGATGDVMES